MSPTRPGPEDATTSGTPSPSRSPIATRNPPRKPASKTVFSASTTPVEAFTSLTIGALPTPISAPTANTARGETTADAAEKTPAPAELTAAMRNT